MDFFGLSLTPLRTFLLLAVVPAAITLVRRRDFRFCSFDWALLLLVTWLFLALTENNGLDRAIKYGGALGLEAVGGYLIARAYIRSASQLTRMLKAYVLLIVVIGLFSIPEALYGIRFFSFLGSPALDPLALVNENPGYTRLGMHRASVTFDHPILYGTFCATALGMAWYIFLNSRLRWAALVAIVVATFFAISSAPLLSCFVVGAFILWEKASRSFAKRAVVTAWIVGGLAVVIEAFSNRSIVAALLPFVSLDHHTAYYRLLIWEFASNNIMDSPIFGIGLNTWVRPAWMPSSVDSFWLVVALTGGFPAIILLVTFVILLLVKVHKQTYFPEPAQHWQMRFAWTAAVLSLCLQAFTVHYWGAMHSFFFFVLGLGAWMAEGNRYLSPRTVAAPRVLLQRPRLLHSSWLKARRPLAVPASQSRSA